MFLVRIKPLHSCLVVDSQIQAPSIHVESGKRCCWMSGYLWDSETEFLSCWSGVESDQLSYEGGFSIVEINDGVASISRDRNGLYPLYYCRFEGDWLFSDSISCIAKYSGLMEVNRLAIGRFFAFDAWNSDLTLLSGVKMLPAGSTYKLQNGRMKEISCHDIPYTELNLESKDGILEMTDETIHLVNCFIERIERKFKGPLCNLLSGGVDSSLLQALLCAKHYSSSFCATYKNEGMDGSYATQVAEKLDSDLSVKVIDDTFFESKLSDYICQTESPFVNEGEVMIGALLEELAQDFEVCFHGEGADAIFGSRRSLQIVTYLARLPRAVLYSLCSRCFPERIRELAQLIYLENTIAPKALYAFCNSLERLKKAQKLVPDFKVEDSWKFEIDQILSYTSDPVERLRKLHVFHFSIQENISILFRLAATKGIFVAHPFMDVELMTYLLSIPTERLFGLRTAKRIPKLALERYLPRNLIYRTKISKRVDFPSLWASSSYFKEIINEIIDSKYDFMNRVDLEFFSKEVEFAKKLIAFHIWYKKVRYD